jgi:hypothetical protein
VINTSAGKNGSGRVGTTEAKTRAQGAAGALANVQWCVAKTTVKGCPAGAAEGMIVQSTNELANYDHEFYRYFY